MNTKGICFCDIECQCKETENGLELKISSKDEKKVKTIKNIVDGFKQFNCNCDTDCCNCCD